MTYEDKIREIYEKITFIPVPKETFEIMLKTIDDQSYQMISHDITWYPTTTTTTTPSTTTNSTTATAAAATTNTNAPEFAAATENNEVKFLGGTLGKGVVLLSNEQVDSLLDKLGVDAFDYYVDKLSSFIIKNDAKVKNHYQTILKWFKQDKKVQLKIKTLQQVD